MRAEVSRLGLGDYTDAGAFYPKVDGKPVGENGRAFWPTREEAQAVADRCLARQIAHESNL